ncbi:MAG: hypothetical protein QOI63_1492 [Thermoplasmata archaeon]|nr:hypothetical protein [Thermoplasmata archaeon]
MPKPTFQFRLSYLATKHAVPYDRRSPHAALASFYLALKEALQAQGVEAMVHGDEPAPLSIQISGPFAEEDFLDGSIVAGTGKPRFLVTLTCEAKRQTIDYASGTDPAAAAAFITGHLLHAEAYGSLHLPATKGDPWYILGFSASPFHHDPVSADAVSKAYVRRPEFERELRTYLQGAEKVAVVVEGPPGSGLTSAVNAVQAELARSRDAAILASHTRIEVSAETTPLDLGVALVWQLHEDIQEAHPAARQDPDMRRVEAYLTTVRTSSLKVGLSTPFIGAAVERHDGFMHAPSSSDHQVHAMLQTLVAVAAGLGLDRRIAVVEVPPTVPAAHVVDLLRGPASSLLQMAGVVLIIEGWSGLRHAMAATRADDPIHKKIFSNPVVLAGPLKGKAFHEMIGKRLRAFAMEAVVASPVSRHELDVLHDVHGGHLGKVLRDAEQMVHQKWNLGLLCGCQAAPERTFPGP